jgi:hypothetical protein
MKAIVKLSVVLIFWMMGFLCMAQEPDKQSHIPVNKKQLSIRPNSRDYGTVIRNNSFQRIDRPHKQEFLLKMQQNHQRKFIKKEAKQSKHVKMNQRRNMMLHNRRTFRK